MILVPVGTVIHLVEGDIPSIAEKPSSEPLDPWDIPGTLELHESEAGQPSPSTDGNGMEKVKKMDINDVSSSCKRTMGK